MLKVLNKAGTFRRAHIGVVAGFFVLLVSLLIPVQLTAQTDPTKAPSPTQPSSDWAYWLNGLLPQGVPQQTIQLATFDVGSGSMSWDPSVVWQSPLVRCFTRGPAGPIPAPCPPATPAPTITSYNVNYQISIAGKPAGYDLQVILTNPTANGGSEDVVGTIEAPGSAGSGVRSLQPAPPNKGQPAQQRLFQGTAVATIAFHPQVFAQQTLKFSHAGALLNCGYGNPQIQNPCSFTMQPYLLPQLGGFVVPYVPIAVIYQPPGCGQCITDTPNGPVPSACGSSATYGQATMHGVTTTLERAGSSGIVKTSSPQDFLGYISQAASFASFVGGPTAAPYFKTVSTIADTLQGLYKQTTTTTTAVNWSQTATRGWVITDGEDWNTAVCQGEDSVVFLGDVLFVYAVIPIDPFSGFVSLDGIPTVFLTPLKWDAPRKRTFSQLQEELAPSGDIGLAVLKQFQNLRYHACRHRAPCTTAEASYPRLVEMPIADCPAPTSDNPPPPHLLNAPDDYLLKQEQLISAGTAQETTMTVVTSVTGLIASLYGQAGTTTTSMSHSTDVTSQSSVSQEAALHLECPEAVQFGGREMDIYLDPLFDTLIAVPGPFDNNTPLIAGRITNERGQPVGKTEVLLKAGGKTYQVFSDARGKYAFRFASIPRGPGVLIAGNKTFWTSYNGTPVKENLRVGVTSSSLSKIAGGANLANVTNPNTPCCDITKHRCGSERGHREGQRHRAILPVHGEGLRPVAFAENRRGRLRQLQDAPSLHQRQRCLLPDHKPCDRQPGGHSAHNWRHACEPECCGTSSLQRALLPNHVD